MTRRTKLILLVMALVSVLGLTVATNAWFVSVSATPPGNISSALVHYLPDGGAQTIPNILTYGNLVSGSGADPDGVALVLPGDRLLPRITGENGEQVVRTSIARPFETGETTDTVIHWELRTATLNDGSTVTLTSKQRDLMRVGVPQHQWLQTTDPVNAPWEVVTDPKGLPPPSADYCYYYSVPVQPKALSANTDGKPMADTAGTIALTLIDQPSLKEHSGDLVAAIDPSTIEMGLVIQVEAVQPNRYREFWGIDALPQPSLAP